MDWQKAIKKPLLDYEDRSYSKNQRGKKLPEKGEERGTPSSGDDLKLSIGGGQGGKKNPSTPTVRRVKNLRAKDSRKTNQLKERKVTLSRTESRSEST